MESFRELRRPWKLASLACGIALLIAGAIWVRAPDWDIPVSLIMALFAYLTAPWCLRMLLGLRWRTWPWVALVTWWSVDGCYALYWSWRNPLALEQMRDANLMASLGLYGLCGLVWLYRGSLTQLWGELRSVFRSADTG